MRYIVTSIIYFKSIHVKSSGKYKGIFQVVKKKHTSLNL